MLALPLLAVALTLFPFSATAQTGLSAKTKWGLITPILKL
jgi:hypothetical protein